MQTIVLLGSNIAHSRSPRLHNHLFALYDLPFRYELMPLDVADVPAALAMMKQGGYRGANVTSPHKFVVLPAMDRLSAAAARIGAVNTIVIDGDDGTSGHMTDAVGFGAGLAGDPLLERPFTVAILGAGGAAQAAVLWLLGVPAVQAITLYTRHADFAVTAAARWKDERVRGGTLAAIAPADLVIQATPVGLAGDPRMPVDPSALDGAQLLYEMIYSPAVTPLMRAVAGRNIRTIGGARMFVGQALAAFELWTGIRPDPKNVPADLFE